jgi:hypothetical protein
LWRRMTWAVSPPADRLGGHGAGGVDVSEGVVVAACTQPHAARTHGPCSAHLPRQHAAARAHPHRPMSPHFAPTACQQPAEPAFTAHTQSLAHLHGYIPLSPSSEPSVGERQQIGSTERDVRSAATMSRPLRLRRHCLEKLSVLETHRVPLPPSPVAQTPLSYNTISPIHVSSMARV